KKYHTAPAASKRHNPPNTIPARMSIQFTVDSGSIGELVGIGVALSRDEDELGLGVAKLAGALLVCCSGMFVSIPSIKSGMPLRFLSMALMACSYFARISGGS